MRSSQLREVENAGPLPSPKSATNNVSHASEDVHKAGPSAGPSKPLSPAADLSAAPSPEPVGHPCPPKSPSPRPVDSPRPAAAADLTGPKPLPSTSAQSTTPALSKRSITAAKLAASVSTPITRTPTPLTRLASRVTPWLGGTTRAPSSSRKPRDSFGSDDAPSPAPTRRLVRDRTGTTSLLEDAPRSATRLDFEGLTPAERAAERKRLAALPAAERRKVYAAYKGKGRYVAPSDTTTFADEYEIDPARNDGVGYQFDAVVRDRAARRRMHGGDCECCRDYYAAVGDIPRFHSAPAWRDEPDGDAGGAGAGDTPAGVGIEDHQKRVSRHREVWRRPPTPPDFWKIAFPTTQEVEDVNRRADEMTAAREAEVRREAA
ncbi:uncharacterized protein COLE_07236 [Cutaneotrichosporon oleaginosum]|nr:hypothetical protein COLE_07236 [Cutaneotrichosporon oleaginosum]